MKQINQTLTLFAPAKLNLNLEVVGKDRDNFHFIKSQVCFLKLYDIITLRFNKNSLILVDKKNSKFCLDEETILKKTITMFKKRFNWRKNFKITLTKNIPIGAGLGGGSADAASLLLGLRKIYNQENNNKVTINNLLTIGKDIGSDVPACIYSRSLIATGKGENISMCSMPNNKHFLILFPGISISTRNIFQNFDKKKYNDIFVNSFESIKVINSLLPVVSCIEPKIKQILSILKSLNNVQSYGMTGSGSACYAIFNNINDLKNALRMIKIRRENDWFIWYGKKKEFGFNRFLY